MISPARRHFQSVTAGAAAIGATDPAAQTVQARYKALLDAHQATLSKLQSRKAKIEAKRAFVAEYAPYVEGVLLAGAGGDDGRAERQRFINSERLALVPDRWKHQRPRRA